MKDEIDWRELEWRLEQERLKTFKQECEHGTYRGLCPECSDLR